MKDQVWIWDNGEGGIFYFDVGETVRFRVEQEEWHDQVPSGPDLQDGLATPDRKPPYSIIVCQPSTPYNYIYIYVYNTNSAQGSMQVAGLGLVAWWS